MGISETVKDASERHILDIVVTAYSARSGEAVEVLLRIPGRPGSVRRLWRAPVRSFDTVEMQDLTAWLVDAVGTAITGLSGAQEVLPFG